MTVDEFQQTLGHPSPPAGASPLLQAMWHDARGEWEAAHQLAQDVAGESGAWVHAYLHRKEGDEANAGYWYRHAGRPHSRQSLQDEWREIAEALLR